MLNVTAGFVPLPENWRSLLGAAVAQISRNNDGPGERAYGPGEKRRVESAMLSVFYAAAAIAFTFVLEWGRFWIWWAATPSGLRKRSLRMWVSSR